MSNYEIIDVDELINNFDIVKKSINQEKIANPIDPILNKEFEEYCKLYEERFGKRAYIAEPSGTMEKTIAAIKIYLEKDEDVLDKLFYPNIDEDMKNGVLY